MPITVNSMESYKMENLIDIENFDVVMLCDRTKETE
jgi:hypothetical protein